MLRKLLISGNRPQEGDLYKAIRLHGVTFEIRYGYYEEIDRAGEPVVIYPDFLEKPVYTQDGRPFVTLMQDACPHYRALRPVQEPDCSSCIHLQRGEELIGTCRCPKNSIPSRQSQPEASTSLGGEHYE